jgi:hypothetical protein
MKRSLGRCLSAALLLGMSLAGSGMATGQTAPRVLSDTVRFAGQATPGPVPNGYLFKSTSCTLTSDTEVTGTSEGSNLCQQFTQVVLRSDGTAVGNSVIASSDGVIVWSFNTGGSGSNSSMGNMMAQASGPGTEYDSPDPGMPTPPGYPVTVRGSFTLTPAPNRTFNVTGTETVYEAAGAP